MEDGAEAPHGAWAELGGLEDGGVAGGDGVEDGADTKNVGGVPCKVVLVEYIPFLLAAA